MKHVITELCWPAGVRLLSQSGPTLYDPDLHRDKERLIGQLGDCVALIVRNQTRVSRELLDRAPQLKVVGRLGVGLDNLDLPALRERGIAVVTGGNANAIAVAEYTLAAMLALARRIAPAHANTRAGGWDRAAFTGTELYGKTLGLVGLGDIGARVARRAAAFGMDLVAHDPVLTPSHFAPSEFGARLMPLDEMLSAADVVSLHVPLVDATRHLINRERLALMKHTAHLVNSSRGGIIDEAALYEALRDGRLGGAALDVREVEPPPAGDALASLPNVLVTPHIGGLTEEAQDKISTAVAEDALRVVRGERPLFGVK